MRCWRTAHRKNRLPIRKACTFSLGLRSLSCLRISAGVMLSIAPPSEREVYDTVTLVQFSREQAEVVEEGVARILECDLGRPDLAEGFLA
jgi:hypothetical protein